MVKWRQPEGGLYFWAQLPKHFKTGLNSKVFECSLKAKVLYLPGAMCYADDPTRKKPDYEMRLSFGSATDSDLAHGIHRLGKAIRQALAGTDISHGKRLRALFNGSSSSVKSVMFLENTRAITKLGAAWNRTR